MSSSKGQSKSQRSQYDPQQDMQEKREVRKGYRALIAESEEAQNNIADVTTDQLTDMIRRGDDLNKKVKAPTEGVLDSRFLLNMSDLGQRKAKSMKLDTASFDIEEYMLSLAKFIGGDVRAAGAGAHRNVNHSSQEEDELEGGNTERWDWDKLGRAAARYSRRAPTIDFLLGPLEVQHKQRKVGQRKKFERPEPEAQAQRLQQEDIQRSENETTKLVKKIYEKLEGIGGEEGVSLFKFAINPESFSDSVENLFYISFLVRDGKVSIEDNQDGIPMLLAVDQPSEEDLKGGLTSIQLIVEFEMKTWKDLIEAFDITQPMIPTRKVANTGPVQAGKWYA